MEDEEVLFELVLPILAPSTTRRGVSLGLLERERERSCTSGGKLGSSGFGVAEEVEGVGVGVNNGVGGVDEEEGAGLARVIVLTALVAVLAVAAETYDVEEDDEEVVEEVEEGVMMEEGETAGEEGGETAPVISSA